MWLSEKLASFWYDLANVGLIVGLVVGVFSTGVVVWTGKVKERYLRGDLRDKDVQIANAKSLASDADERAGRFQEEAARLTAVNLQLEAAIEPRRLTRRQQEALASLSAFSASTVDIKSYSSDTEGLILATEIMEGLSKSHLRIEDNRLTVQPAGSVSFGVSVEGKDHALVKELKRILSIDGNLTATSSIASPRRGGFSARVAFGQITGPPPSATIMVGAKPIK